MLTQFFTEIFSTCWLFAALFIGSCLLFDLYDKYNKLIIKIIASFMGALGIIFCLTDFVALPLRIVAMQEGCAQGYCGSLVLGILNEEYHFDSKIENTYLDWTTRTTQQEREEAHWKGVQEANAKAHAAALAKKIKQENNEFNSFVTNLPKDLVVNLGTPKMFKMAAANYDRYENVPVYENDKEYIVITRDLQKRTIKKSDFAKCERYNGIVSVKGELYPTLTSSNDVYRTYIWEKANGDYMTLNLHCILPTSQIAQILASI